MAAADVASGTVHVINWLVFLEQDAQFVGKVKDILEIGRLSESNDEGDVQLCYILKVEEGRGHRSSEWSEKVELLVPLVDEFVRNIDVERKRILINVCFCSAIPPLLEFYNFQFRCIYLLLNQ